MNTLQRSEPAARTHSQESVQAHGGTLVDRVVPGNEVLLLLERAARLPVLTLDAREVADLELLAIGAASPLTGFLGRDDYQNVLERWRLADGTVWPLPLTLAIDAAALGGLEPGGEAALADTAGRLWGSIQVEEIHKRDPLVEAQHLYGTQDPSHPGVAYLLERPRSLVAGPVRVLPLPEDLPFAEYRFTPRELRQEIARRGWRQVAGFQTRNPIHRAHEYLTKLALEQTDGLVIHPLVGETKSDDVPATVRFRAYEALVRDYYPRERTLLAAFPAAMRYAGPREAVFHALVRKNYGIGRLIVGRDHAGVGKFYRPTEAQEVFARFPAEDLGVAPLFLPPTFYCRRCETLASERTCPHGAETRLDLSGTRVREILRAGDPLPKEFTRPEVADVLRRHYRESLGAAPATSMAADGGRLRPTGGFILWFTGLSGAGKTTLAQALRERLAGALEVLDGDEVRTNLSAGLGFSRADRDINVRRIGYVARLLARNGVAVASAAISPYASTRAEVRRAAEDEGVPFVEVFAQAALETLVERDVKGLYRKALAGEIAHFTGVSDPYEAPDGAEVVVHSDREPVAVSLERIVDYLGSRALLSAAPATGGVS